MEVPGAQLGELRLPPRPKFHADVPLKWGIVLGVLLAAWFQLFYQTDWYLTPRVGLFLVAGNMVLTAVSLSFVARTIRRRDAHVATFARIFFYCILTGFAAGLVNSVHDLAFNLVIDPAYSERVLLAQRDIILANQGNAGVSPEQIQQALANNQATLDKLRLRGNSPSNIVAGTVSTILLYCGIYGVLVAAIFRWPGSWVNKN